VGRQGGKLLHAHTHIHTYTHTHTHTHTQVYALSGAGKEEAFDGVSLGIINRNNTSLFGHELLYNCWITLARTRSSFTAYWANYKRTCIFTAGDNPDDIRTITEFFDNRQSYKQFKDACFDYKTLLKVDVKGIFACECDVADRSRRHVMYDNACNAETVASNRDATFLEHNILKVDEFHHAKSRGGHQNCSPFCCSASCASLVNVNTSYIEQVNSVLVNARISAPFFAQDTFIEFMEGIVMFYNLDQQERNLRRRAEGTMLPMPMAVKQCDAVCISIKHQNAFIQLPNEKPVVVVGSEPISGVSVADRMMIPDLSARKVLRELLSRDGADAVEAEKYLRDEPYLHKCLVPYIQWQAGAAGKVHLSQELKPLSTWLKHLASNACELQNIPALILPAARKIACGQLITPEEKSLVQTHSPGLKQLLLYDLSLRTSGQSVPVISEQLRELLHVCIKKCETIITSGKAPKHPTVDDGWTDHERKVRTATIAPNRPVISAYPDFTADRKLLKSKNAKEDMLCSKYATFSKKLMPGLFVVVCIGCRKIEMVQMMPSYESPLTAYKAMYLRDWS
jgi:hypothetical protein